MGMNGNGKRPVYSWRLTDFNVTTHVFRAYNLVFILVFAVLEL